MAQDIDDHFVTQFEAELYTAFYNKGGFFRNKVRVKHAKNSAVVQFPKFTATTAEAQPKTRHGDVAVLESTRDTKTVTMKDRYASDFIDKLDEIKTNVAERGAIVEAIRIAMARTEDTMVLTALNTSGGYNSTLSDLTANDTYSTDAVFRGMVEDFGAAEMFDGQKLYAAVPWSAWSQLLALETFANADWGGDTSMSTVGQKAKMFMGFEVFPYSRLPLNTSKRTAIFWNPMCVGLAIGQDIGVEVGWRIEKQAWQIVGSMSMEAVVIDSTGVVLRQHNST